MVFPLITVESVLVGKLRRVQVVRAVPVNAFRRRTHDIDKRGDLAALVMPPGGVTGLGDPDFSFGAVLQKNSAHARDLRVPAIPPEFKGSGVTVNPDRIDVLHYTAFAHQA